MPLLMEEDELLEIEVRYKETEKGIEIFNKDAPSDAACAKFYFKRPCWGEYRTIMSASVNINVADGQAMVDPYKLSDLRLKKLLKDWTIENKNGKIPITPANVDMLQPRIAQYLIDKLNQAFPIE
jgi:hypothetical protein